MTETQLVSVSNVSTVSAEDIFSCQDVVDNQPVTIRVMDTFDQVLNAAIYKY